MFASELIVSEITPVSPANTGDDALRIMEDFFIRHLPIVDGHEVIGIISGGINT
ncbi:MAG: CBS domain-containing protein [Saprospiraceae bacterium]|nr:CBS domain-containing protein [Candidatus Brachybacter algidus]